MVDKKPWEDFRPPPLPDMTPYEIYINNQVDPNLARAMYYSRKASEGGGERYNCNGPRIRLSREAKIAIAVGLVAWIAMSIVYGILLMSMGPATALP